jgi:hypothetical protein
MVYVWRSPRDYPPSMVGQHHPIGTADYLDYHEARKLPDDYQAMDFVKFDQPLAKLLRYDYLHGSLSAPLVSARLRNAVEKAAPGEAQFLPATIVAKDGQSEDYTVVNALRQVHAIDWKTSFPTYFSDEKTIAGWHQLNHLPDGMGDVGIGRDADYLSVILVSERVKTELDRGGFKFRGLGLRLASDMAW